MFYYFESLFRWEHNIGRKIKLSYNKSPVGTKYRIMANTYTQIQIQAVFCVQNRDCIINNSWKDELFKYITRIIRKGYNVPTARFSHLF